VGEQATATERLLPVCTGEKESKGDDRVAIQVDASSPWQWKATPLSSFDSLF